MAKFASSHKLLCTENTISGSKGKKEHASCFSMPRVVQRNTRQVEIKAKLNVIVLEAYGNHHGFHESPRNSKTCMVVKAMSGFEKHMKSLDLYLGKLDDEAKKPSLKSLNQSAELAWRREQLEGENGVQAVDILVRVKGEESDIDLAEDFSIISYATKEQENDRGRSLINYMESTTEEDKFTDNASDFYLTGILASVNIAVFLFELAAPVQNLNLELFSLPMVYGAKINSLILTGEWWRLVTPMFLHEGILHIALGCWGLFTFGPEVSQKYGSFTFLLIYFLGGISGNLISFLHTPETTIGGTDPLFALIGAWLIYQVQNKDILTSTDASEQMFRKAIIITAISFVFSNFGHTDDWAHFAAAFTGVAYGFLTCPTLQVKDATTSSETGRREERVTLIRRYADPCKSLIYFSLFVLLLSSLLLIIEPPLYLI